MQPTMESTEMPIIFPQDIKEIEKYFEEYFDPKKYLETYYSEGIDPITIKNIFIVLQVLRDQLKKNNGVVNIKEVAVAAGLSERATEDLEDIMIYEFQRKIVLKFLEVYPGDKITILDVGAGPTIYQDIIISLTTDSITHSEFLKKNRDEVIKWLEGKEDCYNWDAYFVLIKKMLLDDDDFENILLGQLQSADEDVRAHAEKIWNIIFKGEKSEIEALKEHLRQCLLGKVTAGNIFEYDLGLPPDQEYDAVQSLVHQIKTPHVITSNFGIESATPNKSDWEKGMRNIINKVKPGGFLALTIIRNAQWYMVGNHKFRATSINENEVKEFLENNGCEVLSCQVLTGFNQKKLGYDGIILVFAQKKQ